MALKIGVIGATGMAGSAITKAALDQGIEVTAFIRNEEKARGMFGDQPTYRVIDVFDIGKPDIADLDVVVDAFSPGHDPKNVDQHLELAQHLVELVKGSDKPRLFFILGAASLNIGGGKQLLDQLETLPNKEQWIATPRAQHKEYNFLLQAKDVNWVAISPSRTFKPGDFAPYELGHNDVLTNAEGKSEVTSGTVGRVIVDEIMNPAHHNERFTVVNK
ncbi:hypothetical protein HMPREF9103_02131 [Lentilactobacillus parafarraginis F0439]|uniref:NAD(P)-binding domain-containing protein n=1 Tax=Lentilactobacillus parafarraginis F0439 TaxID=797515 RepID=G9ZQX3_9LACO|nr:NAD(P)H-binding protein [Lentilactobacillus parafarraginis]EHL97075.1 hypothetical protein HMPREF9103_02131 [Lentilactobacillus parafarraginis F0439]